jgi:hypothetical protein
MEVLKSYYNIIATALFVLAIIIAHIAAPDFYSFRNNTISHLGAQGYNHKEIMQFGFLAFGTIITVGFSANQITLKTLPVFIYGFSVGLTGIFCTKPFEGLAPMYYSSTEANIHSAFAQIAGIAFTVALLIHVFFADSTKEKLIHVAFLIAVVALSASFGFLESNQGIFQRLLYIVSFIWFVRFFKP